MGLKCVRFIILSFLLYALTTGATQVLAWERPINIYLADLTDLGRAPRIEQHADDFKLGTDDPIRERKARPWDAPPDHTAVAALAGKAYQAALSARNQALSARHLGRACYFLQDLADPTRRLRSLQHTPHEEEIRRAAEQLAAQLIHEQYIGEKRSAYWDMAADTARLMNGSDWNTLIAVLWSSAQESATNIYENLRKADPDPQNDVSGPLARSFATIVACQNRLLSLYQNGEGLDLATQEPDTGRSSRPAFHDRIRLEVWDASCEDGDRIDLRVNGVLRLSNLTLAKKKTILDLSLPRGINVLEIYALNSGSDCPAKPKPRTHASVAVRVAGGGLNLQKSWLIREGERKRLEFRLK